MNSKRRGATSPEPVIFAKYQTLNAEDLNDACEYASWEAAVRAGAPAVAGLFRPWWAKGDVNVIDLCDNRQKVKVQNLFLLNDSGRLVHIAHDTHALMRDCAWWLFVNESGELRTDEGPTGSAGYTLLAHKRAANLEVDAPLAALEVDAPLAALDATKRSINAYDQATRASRQWLDKLDGAGRSDTLWLAGCFALAAERIPSVSDALGRLARCASVLAQVLDARGFPNDAREFPYHALQNLRTAPSTLAAHSVEQWLKAWVEIIDDEKLRIVVCSDDEWIRPFYRSMSTELRDLREYRFNISRWRTAKTFQVRSSEALEGARWSYSTSGQREVLRATKHDGPYYLAQFSSPAPHQGKTLSVWVCGKDVDVCVRALGATCT